MNRDTIVSAFKGIYFVLVGLAIVNSLRPMLIRILSIRYVSTDWLAKTGEFFNYIFVKDPVVLLWLAFLITLIRFTFGGIHSLVVDKSKENGYVRFLFDLHFYTITLILFFVLGSFVGYPGRFVLTFLILIYWDLFWILLVEILLGGGGLNAMFQRLNSTVPWIGTDFGMLIALYIASPAAIVLGAIMVAILDYTVCRREYW